jgi:hypothetical protein
VAEMHGGAAWAAPPPTGRTGAELHLRLPALPANGAALEPATAATSTPGPTAT